MISGISGPTEHDEGGDYSDSLETIHSRALCCDRDYVQPSYDYNLGSSQGRLVNGMSDGPLFAHLISYGGRPNLAPRLTLEKLCGSG